MTKNIPPTADMRRSWLVQRLKAPIGGRLATVAEAFAFGGGFRNGGLSGDAMSVLRGILRFDYMGAAEFEWGAVPKALTALARHHADLTAFTLSVPLADVAPHWQERNAAAPEGSGTVYVLCQSAHAREVERRIREWAKAGHNAETKETLGLSASLRPHTEWDAEVIGWLELDNGFMFFTSREMWESCCALFGVTVTDSAAAR